MRRFYALLIVGVFSLIVPNISQAQQVRSVPADTAAVQPSPATAHYYKLNFVVRETNEGKVLSERSYSLGVATEGAVERDWWSLRAGTRVPTGSNYVDVGFNVDVRTLEVGSALQLRVKADVSSLPTDVAASNSTMPPIRQMRVEEVALVPVGKPTIIFVGEDPNSKHRFELEVTAVREK
jgi:hypothetical protein